MLGKSNCPWSRALADDAARIGSLQAAAARVRVPWLLVHGDADEMVPLEDATDAIGASGGAREHRPELVPLAGADHRFGGAIPHLIAAVVPWLVSKLVTKGIRDG
jgi:putative redox protein